MKQVFVSTACAIAFAALVTGCASETSGPSETGNVSVNLLVGDTDVTAVNFVVTCDDSTVCPLSGQFNVIDRGPNEPPVWATIMDLPVGDPDNPIVYNIALTALDDAGAVLCTGDKNFTVDPIEPTKVNVVLTCGGDGEELLGNVDIDATFEIIDGNRCPRLHFLNAVPIDVPAEGSQVTVLVSDADEDPLTTALTATPGGSFADPSAQLTTYFCDGAAGGQTISVTVSDGDVACDKSKSFDVTCPGVNLCEGVVCDDTCNQCTVGICTNQSAPECEETNVDNDTPCIAGIPGWVTEFCTPPEFSGPCEKTDTMANTGTSSARIFNDIPGTPSVLKQANKGKGIVQPGDTVTVSFWAKGTGENGGVAFAEFFTELEGGGTSSSQILGGAPLSLLPDQFQFFSFEVTVGDPAGGGVTVQFNAATGAIEGSTSKLFVDDVSITLESGVDVADNGGVEEGTVNSTCQEGVCEPIAECTVAGDCTDDGNECTDPVCNAGVCETSNNSNACDGGNGTCDGQGNCVPNAECAVAGDCPDTGNECIDPVCNAGVCETSNNTNACDGGAGTCSGGQCVPNALALYAQDFEPPMDVLDPDALILDTAAEVPLGPWLAFLAVFDGTVTPPAFKFQFGPFGAPNATADTNPDDGQTFISAVVTGEGNGLQGEQQLSVFSDYNCCDPDPLDPGTLRQGHGNGTDRVEMSVFQELNPIPNSLIGQTLTFSFDAKRGNIELATTALAYIQTLNTSFQQTNFVPFDLTGIPGPPGTWNRYEITLDLTNPDLEGQILQIGFRNTAQNFEGSGIFFDNVEANLTPAAP